MSLDLYIEDNNKRKTYFQKLNLERIKNASYEELVLKKRILDNIDWAKANHSELTYERLCKEITLRKLDKV